MKIISVEEAVSKIKNGDSIVVSGFVDMGIPEYIMEAIEKEYLATGAPRDLTVIWDATAGIFPGEGVDHLAHKGLVKRAIASHINLQKGMQELVDDNQILAHIIPVGAMTQLFREIGGGRPGFISRVGLDTFADPRVEGCRGNELTKDSGECYVELMEIHGEEYLFFKPYPTNVAILRGTSIDSKGNLTCEREALLDDTLTVAQCVKATGGIVIAQVERVVERGQLNPRNVVVPGIMIDYAVVAPPDKHRQCSSTPYYSGAFAHEYRVDIDNIAEKLPLDERKIIARRAALELHGDAIINLGIGVPGGISAVAAEEGIADRINMTVECGQVGGLPADSPDFGACYNPDYVVDMTRQFNWYDGGALDMAFLGAAEVDQFGNANVSKFTRTVGPGGFINISGTAKRACFCGTLTAGGLEISAGDGKLNILKEGKVKKYVKDVKQITFSGKRALLEGRSVLYITERAVFELTPEGMCVIEIAPGIDLKTQVLDMVDFELKVSPNLKLMDEAIFREEKMGISL